jgi:hypothetical protein
MAGGFDHESPQRNLKLLQSIAKFNGIWQRPLWRSRFSMCEIPALDFNAVAAGDAALRGVAPQRLFL